MGSKLGDLLSVGVGDLGEVFRGGKKVFDGVCQTGYEIVECCPCSVVGGLVDVGVRRITAGWGHGNRSSE